MNQQKQVINSLMMAIKNELNHINNHDLLNDWYQCINDISLRSLFQYKIQSNGYHKLNQFINDLNEQLNHEYNMYEYIKNDQLIKKYYQHLEEHGPFSSCYREILCLIYNINLSLYAYDNDNVYCLLDSHNINAKKYINCVYDHDNYIELIIDQQYYELDIIRNHLNNQYKCILYNIINMKYKHDVDKYLTQKLYFNNNIIVKDVIDTGDCLKHIDNIIELCNTNDIYEKQNLKQRLEIGK